MAVIFSGKTPAPSQMPSRQSEQTGGKEEEGADIDREKQSEGFQGTIRKQETLSQSHSKGNPYFIRHQSFRNGCSDASLHF